jgi:hypothetical protein
MTQKVTNADFIDAWKRLRSPAKVAKLLGLDIRGVYRRRALIELNEGISLITDDDVGRTGLKSDARKRIEQLNDQRFTHAEYEAQVDLADGVVVVFSDAHYWPDIVTVAHRALVEVIKRLRPKMVIANGDVLDGATISRHPRIGWESRPTVQQEIEAMCLRMREVELAASGAQLVRTFGNHDLRFESYIAANAPALEGVHGTSLFDFLPAWRGCYALHLNTNLPGWTVVKHTHVAGGVHSAYNSTLRAGVSYVHGHLHKLQVVGYGDYRGRRYGIDTGTLAEPKGEQFRYTQGGPLNWCSGFAVLTYRDGELLPPELCEVVNGKAWFRGERIILEN